MLNRSSRTAVQVANRLLPQDVMLSAAVASGAMGTQMLRCAQHDSSDGGPGRPSPLTGEVFSPDVYCLYMVCINRGSSRRKSFPEEVCGSCLLK